jgi:hypothetical protein
MGPRLFRDNEDFKGYVTTLSAVLGRSPADVEGAADQAILLVMKLQLAKLNVRCGPDRIIKVVANSSIGEFPDSHQCNISQCKLKVAKGFVGMAI